MSLKDWAFILLMKAEVNYSNLVGFLWRILKITAILFLIRMGHIACATTDTILVAQVM